MTTFKVELNRKKGKKTADKILITTTPSGSLVYNPLALENRVNLNL